jgi:hypothetical protein
MTALSGNLSSRRVRICGLEEMSEPGDVDLRIENCSLGEKGGQMVGEKGRHQSSFSTHTVEDPNLRMSRVEAQDRSPVFDSRTHACCLIDSPERHLDE